MRLGDATVLAGRNVHHSSSVIRQRVHLGRLAGLRSGSAGEGFAERYEARFGALKTLVPIPGGGMPSAFLEELRSAQGAPFADVVFQAVLAVENSMAFAMHRLDAIGFAVIEAGTQDDRVDLIWRCRVPEVSRRVARLAHIGLRELLPESLGGRAAREASFERAYADLWSYARRKRLSPSTTLLTLAADRAGIPWELLGGQFIRLGQGRLQKRIWSSVTGATSFLGCRLALDKRLTNRILADLRLPVPRQRKASSAERALRIAAEIGYPVVVKPILGQKGGGVSAGLRAPDEVPPAFERANRRGGGVIVESFVEGQDHRLLVVGGAFVAGTKRLPPRVTGDGVRTIAELIAKLNEDPLRDDLRRCQVTRDEELDRLLGKAGYKLDDVLPSGEMLALRSTANVSTGGSPVDVTDAVHPDNREMAVRVAEALELDVAGIDFLTTDISRSYKERGGIIEVNSRPGLRPHSWPVEGKPRDVAGALISYLFPPDHPCRVPTVLVAGGTGSRTIARDVDHLLRSAGTSVGLVTTDGAFVNGDPVGLEGAPRPQATEGVMRDPRVEALVSTVSPRQVVRRGLLHDACDASAIVDTGGGNPKEARRGLELLVRATHGSVVVDARSGLALEVVGAVDVSRRILVCRGSTGALRRHLEAGGAAVISARERGERVIVLLLGERREASIPIRAVPALSVEHSRGRLEAVLFAAALAHAMGLSAQEILSGLRNGRPPAVSRTRRPRVAPA